MSLFRIDCSIFIFSISTAYFPRFGSGITTSSLILNALVCFAIAAVLALSNQNLFLASADTAIKPSPFLIFEICTTFEATAPSSSSSSDAISAINTIFGLSDLVAFVE